MTEQQFKAIFDENFPSLRNALYYKCGNIGLAEDIAQDVFVKIWQKRETIDLKTVKGLLYKMGFNLLINQFKKEQVKLAFSKTQVDHVFVETPEFIMESNEFSDKLNHVISEMSEKQRIVFLMSRIDKKKYKEIAISLGISVKAVEKRMHGALEYIYNKLNRKL